MGDSSSVDFFSRKLFRIYLKIPMRGVARRKRTD
jgi:hypothetical protein